MLTIAVLDIYSFSHSVLHKYSFLRIKIPSVFHEKVRFLNILFILSILPRIKKSVRSVRSVCDPFAQFREPVPFITILEIRARFIFLKHQESFRVKFVFEKTKLVFKKIKIRVQKDKIRVPCTASSAIHVICVYVYAHTYAPACVYLIM